MQRNAYVLVELLQHVRSLIPAHHDLAVIGASMGGLIARYALAYMEREGIDHRTRLFMSFDSPHRGANIPLGIQYWVEFFSEDSAEAAFLKDRLDSPAARQLLVYHATDPPGSTGEHDPLMDAFSTDLAAVGDYPEIPRKAAVANGSGYGAGQGFAAGDQLILYEYSSLLVDIIGNVWAVPDGLPGMVFDGLMDLIWPLPDSDMQVVVSGTDPYDSAPGGTRASMAQMDSTEAPYGDIAALHESHCFIPTVSALDLESADLFYDIAGDPSIMDITPFDAIYYAATNEEHVTITPGNAAWIIYEIEQGVTGIGKEEPPQAPFLRQNYPNPFNPRTRIDFVMPSAGRANVTVFDVRGRRVATILDGVLDEGRHSVSWDGRDSQGRSAAAGLYFYRLEACGTVLTRKMVLMK
ncbi:MAG TPA: T9SS type A sorting domain-containing protein [Candidatus Eisenbacteria bacterium]|uniref:T9SS type A sorting domain-containing protein n=1 Tax=Eiseniibacteriota bacterium TaxID=2212470 RepID=A0A7V2AVZ1_UNCEI|nr:T9SS type A sorting domain-containing protein [Candidatus Eisenbacteria bacterium]